MQFGVLGPLAVRTDAGEAVVVPGVKVRVLLADLLAHRNHVVSADRLIDDLWGEDAPAHAAGALQVRVSQLRKALNDAEPGARDLIESRAPGYVLRTAPAAVDADRFAALAEATGVEPLTEALALWRGDPYADTADAEFVRAEASRLAELRLVVRERLAAARLARGEHDLVTAELAELIEQHPLREGARAIQMRALYAAGRPAEALDVYADLRERLADELGLDPGPDLAALHQQILTQEVRPVASALPAKVDELVGRAEAIAEVAGAVGWRRLVTLVGPGGVGKTRLAIEAARATRQEARFVELADSGDVAEKVLTVLDVREAGGAAHSAEDRVLSAVRRQHLLLILDNCEHVIAEAAALTARLLREAEGVTVLATSREPLGLAGEVVWEVPPLDPAAAAELFAARASAHSRTFRLGPHDAPVVAQLVSRLDGLPLALELAATRVRALGVTGVVERLDDRFRLLTTQQRDRPERQRTLTAVIEWSWGLLDETERSVLARLAVFRGGCTPEAAEAVCDADLDVLGRLVDRSLVVVDESGELRYRLLESIAAFALARLADAEETRARHAAYFTELAERADPALRGPAQREWLARLDAEDGNFRAALDHGAGPRLSIALAWYWFLRGRFTEARAALPEGSSWWAGFALRQGRTVEPPPETDPRARWFVASGLLDRSDLATAATMLDEILSDCDPWTEAAALSSRAMLAHAAADLVALERDGARSARLFAELGDRWGRLQATDWVGGLAEIKGEYDRAAAMHREGLRWAEELSLWIEVGSKLSWLAWVAVQTGDYVQARELGERALRLAEEHEHPAAAVFARLCVGFAARRDGKLDVAVTMLEELAGSADPSSLWLPMVLTELGYATGSLEHHLRAFDVAYAANFPRDAATALVGIASATPDEIGAKVLGAAVGADQGDDFRRTKDRLSSALGDRFEALYAEGRALPLPEARALVA